MATAQHKDAAVLPLVLQFVSVEDIAAASTVCKEWRDMAAQDTTIGSVVWHGGVSTVQQVCVASSLFPYRPPRSLSVRAHHGYPLHNNPHTGWVLAPCTTR